MFAISHMQADNRKDLRRPWKYPVIELIYSFAVDFHSISRNWKEMCYQLEVGKQNSIS